MKTEASHFFSGAYFDNQYYDQKPQLDINNQFTIDELLDFSNEDQSLTDGFFGNSADSSTLTVLDTYNSSQAQFSGDFSSTHAQFSTNQLCVPDDELAELEWLSNFVEESFSSDDLQNFHLISATKAPTDSSSSEFRPQTMPTRTHAPPLFQTSVSVPGKARSKRSRAAPCDWSSRLLVLKETEIETKEKGPIPTRKCLHCGSDKTPQWRSGPMGPKTLCNACGVRFKSGRLVPEYRPAASPTFVSAKHSNSHRKVMELRRQKELQVAHQQQLISQTPIFGVSNGQDYLINPQCGPTFRHMI